MVGGITTGGGLGAQSIASSPLRPKPETPETGNPLVKGFGEQLSEASQLIGKAESSATAMAAGSEGSVETILALSRAELALRHVVSVRNRLLESYQEVMRLPL